MILIIDNCRSHIREYVEPKRCIKSTTNCGGSYASKKICILATSTIGEMIASSSMGLVDGNVTHFINKHRNTWNSWLKINELPLTSQTTPTDIKGFPHYKNITSRKLNNNFGQKRPTCFFFVLFLIQNLLHLTLLGQSQYSFGSMKHKRSASSSMFWRGIWPPCDEAI